MPCDGASTAGVFADALPAIANAVPAVAHRCKAVFERFRFLEPCLACAMSEFSHLIGCKPARPRGVPSSRKPINAGDDQHIAGPEKIEVRLQLSAAGSRHPAGFGADHLTAGRVERSLLNRQGLVSRADAIVGEVGKSVIFYTFNDVA